VWTPKDRYNNTDTLPIPSYSYSSIPCHNNYSNVHIRAYVRVRASIPPLLNITLNGYFYISDCEGLLALVGVLGNNGGWV